MGYRLGVDVGGTFTGVLGVVRNLDTDIELKGAQYPPTLLAVIESGGVLNRLRAEGFLADYPNSETKS